MKLWKYGIVGVSLCILICSSLTASAISFSDPIGDVHFGNQSDNYSKIESRPQVDITELSVSVRGNTVVLSLTVAGGIQVSDDIMYSAYVNTTDTRYTMLLNNNEYIMAAAVNRSYGSYLYANESVTVSGDTLSAVINLRGSSSMDAIFGIAQEREIYQDGITGNVWIDNAKFSFVSNSTDIDENTTSNTGKNNTNNNTGTLPGEKTPGFELFLVIVAVSTIIILFRRRR